MNISTWHYRRKSYIARTIVTTVILSALALVAFFLIKDSRENGEFEHWCHKHNGVYVEDDGSTNLCFERGSRIEP